MTPPVALSQVGYPIIPDSPVDLDSWREAGRERGYGYREVWPAPTLPGLLFREGRHAVATDVIDALASPVPFIAGTLTAGYGPARDAASPQGTASSFIAIPIARSMPSMVLVNAHDGALRRAGIGLGTLQALALHGDFDRLFTLYRPLGQSGVATEVFTPELIEMFLQIMPGSDAELADNWIFVYGSESRNTSSNSLERIERIAARVHEAILGRNFGELHEEPAAPEAAAPRPGQLMLFSAILAVTTVAAGAFAWLAMLAQ